MRMKNKIQAIYPQSVFCSSTASKLYIADFSERTNKERKVEFHEIIPKAPDNTSDMDCLAFENFSQLSVVCNIFDDHQFKDTKGKDLPHCECVLFPESKRKDIGMAFVEIKDCKPKNISEYKAIVKNQIISAVQIFRDKGIIEKQRVYGVISFPRKNKVSFNQTIFDDATEYKRLHQKYKVRFFPTNSVSIVDEKKLIAKL